VKAVVENGTCEMLDGKGFYEQQDFRMVPIKDIGMIAKL
jgi:hypothetical protein